MHVLALLLLVAGLASGSGADAPVPALGILGSQTAKARFVAAWCA